MLQQQIQISLSDIRTHKSNKKQTGTEMKYDIVFKDKAS